VSRISKFQNNKTLHAIFIDWKSVEGTKLTGIEIEYQHDLFDVASGNSIRISNSFSKTQNMCSDESCDAVLANSKIGISLIQKNPNEDTQILVRARSEKNMVYSEPVEFFKPIKLSYHDIWDFMSSSGIRYDAEDGIFARKRNLLPILEFENGHGVVSQFISVEKALSFK
jgi:hypothetical protein